MNFAGVARCKLGVEFFLAAGVDPDSEAEGVVLVVAQYEAVICEEEPVGSSAVAVVDLFSGFVVSFVLGREHEVVLGIVVLPPFEAFVLFIVGVQVASELLFFFLIVQPVL